MVDWTPTMGHHEDWGLTAGVGDKGRGDAWQRENRVNYMAAAHPQGPYLTRYSRHRTIPAAAYSRSFCARIYIHTRTPTRPGQDFWLIYVKPGPGEEDTTRGRGSDLWAARGSTPLPPLPVAFRLLPPPPSTHTKLYIYQMVDLPGNGSYFVVTDVRSQWVGVWRTERRNL